MSKRGQIVRVLEASRLAPFLKVHPRWNGLLILNYHRIRDSSASPFDRGVFSATPDALDAQIVLLKRSLHVIAPDDVAAVLDRPRGRHALLTFDDGYRDNYEAAFPILTAHGVHATFFICTGFIDDRPVPWWDEIAWMVRTSPRRDLPASDWLPFPAAFDEPDREGAIRSLLALYKTLPAARTAAFLTSLANATASGRCPRTHGADLWMTWDMVREMAAAGMDVGGHTVTHPVLARLPVDRQRAEINGCQERLTAELGTPARRFAYPVGSRDTFIPETQRIVRDAGFEMAFSFYGNHTRPGHTNPYDVPRVYVAHDTSLAALSAMLAIPRILARDARTAAESVIPKMIEDVDPMAAH